MLLSRNATSGAPPRYKKRWLSSLLALCGCSLWGVLKADSPQSYELHRLTYGDRDTWVDLGVGLWAWPLPVDFDRDGDFDLLVSCPDKPFKGTYFFENTGLTELDAADLPIFEPPIRIADGATNILPSYHGDQIDVLTPGKRFADVSSHGLKDPIPIDFDITTLQVKRLRHNQWRLVDLDGDAIRDLVVAVEDWGDYGWDDAHDAQGDWRNGPLRGHIYWVRNNGTEDQPQWSSPARLQIEQTPVETFGMPTPNFVDWDSDGDQDLLCGEFLDGFTYFRNIGDRNHPHFAPGIRLNSTQGQPLRMDLQMIVPIAFDWDRDGDADLIVGDEDGRVAIVRCQGLDDQGVPAFDPPRYFRQRADSIKFGALITPYAFDWDADGDLDLLCGNTAGYLGWIENITSPQALEGSTAERLAALRFHPARLLQVNGQPIRIQAGRKGSIQGPAEAKWGYTTLAVGDWDRDGLPDLIVNSIWGKVHWYRRPIMTDPLRLEEPRPVRVAWEGETPKPIWTWWAPEPQTLVTQWRTSPVTFDWDRDGLLDLIMLDQEGFLTWLRRSNPEGEAVLEMPQRIFDSPGPSGFDSSDRPTNNEPGPLQLNTQRAGASGRRKLAIGDLDGDSHPDLIVNSRNASWLKGTPGEHGRWIFEPKGGWVAATLAGHSTCPTLGDFDGDGRIDILIGAEDGHLYLALPAAAPGVP